MMIKRFHLWISGKVQGVAYRANTRLKAEELGLGGWVKNLPDGRVEVVVEGEETQIEKLIDWCRKGPPMAFVDQVEIQEEQDLEGFSHFSIRWP